MSKTGRVGEINMYRQPITSGERGLVFTWNNMEVEQNMTPHHHKNFGGIFY